MNNLVMSPNRSQQDVKLIRGKVDSMTDGTNNETNNICMKLSKHSIKGSRRGTIY